MKAGILGTGRIGKVHIKNIAMFVPGIELKAAYDPDMSEVNRAYLKQYGVPAAAGPEEILGDPEIEMMLICSPTDTHTDYVIEAAEKGKHIFCEKPVDFTVARTKEALAAVEKAGVKFGIGFCRRFDHNHKAVRDMVQAGRIGEPQLLKISSQDPAPPTIEYVRSSGGLFFDMMIHDLDMARFQMGCEVEQVYAAGSVLVDPAIGKENDVDTSIVTLHFENGAIGVIDNSREAVYGYDQRVEVFGSKGCAYDGNDTANTAVLVEADRVCSGTPGKVMWDRYTGAFIAEMQAFADAVKNNTQPPVGPNDALQSCLLAAAAGLSVKEGRPVRLSEVAGG